MKRNSLATKQKSGGAVASIALRSLLGIGVVLSMCILQLTDAFIDGLSELLFNEEK